MNKASNWEEYCNLNIPLLALIRAVVTSCPPLQCRYCMRDFVSSDPRLQLMEHVSLAHKECNIMLLQAFAHSAKN